MKAKLLEGEGLDWHDKKFRTVADKTLAGVMVALTNKYPAGAVIAKFYQADRSHVIYCALWVGSDRRGWGMAGGWGYHKSSAALSEAMRRAGVELYGNPYGEGNSDETFPKGKPVHIDGRGHGSMVDAMQAMARAVSGDRKVRVIDL
jgi:hypothetical protein